MTPVLEIAVAVTAITTALLGGLFGLYKWVTGTVRTSQTDSKDEINRLEKRLTDLERTAVSKADHQASITLINNTMEGMIQALRDTTTTLTARMDMLLFEVGRAKNTRHD